MPLPDRLLDNGVPVDHFHPIAKEVLDAPMAAEGFALVEESIESDVENPSYASRIYKAGNRYVKFFVNTYYRDGPAYGNVVLGTGGIEWPDRDWNSIGLWKLAEAKNPAARVGDRPLKNRTMRWFCEHALEDLLGHGRDFLDGDLALFSRLRAEQTRSREGYKVYGPGPLDKQGKQVLRESAEMKEKYSREDAE